MGYRAYGAPALQRTRPELRRQPYSPRAIIQLSRFAGGAPLALYQAQDRLVKLHNGWGSRPSGRKGTSSLCWPSARWAAGHRAASRGTATEFRLARVWVGSECPVPWKVTKRWWELRVASQRFAELSRLGFYPTWSGGSDELGQLQTQGLLRSLESIPKCWLRNNGLCHLMEWR